MKEIKSDLTKKEVEIMFRNLNMTIGLYFDFLKNNLKDCEDKDKLAAFMHWVLEYALASVDNFQKLTEDLYNEFKELYMKDE